VSGDQNEYHVGNLSYEVTEEELQEAFEGFGQIEDEA
jgi:RNA recognition motif-containing protein